MKTIDAVVVLVAITGAFMAGMYVERGKRLQAAVKRPVEDNVKIGKDRVSLGTYRVTAYCADCEVCVNVPEWRDGKTASGKDAEGLIVAAPADIAFGTVLDIEGYGRAVVEDRGGAIVGDKLDVLMSSHSAALTWGVRHIEVFKVLID